MRSLTILLATLLAGPASADLMVRFDEGAPKDRFTLSSTDGCLTGPLDVEIDLSGSAAGLIFDVTGSGAGVEVFQPFELVAGQALVKGNNVVNDGETRVTLSLALLPQSTPVAFTIDVDDTKSARGITVDGGEIAGATIALIGPAGRKETQFGTDATARIAVNDCTS